ncbi:MAG: PucR family transcriptional regulator ligand-binding domain-containing protein [Rhizobiaceae bacterium]
MLTKAAKHNRPAAAQDVARDGISDFGIAVEECLGIAPLSQATVVAGRAALRRRMNWVHVVDHRDMEDSLNTHELLLKSGVALAADPTLQREIFEILDRKQSAGLVISIGETFRKSLRRCANWRTFSRFR